MVYVPLRKVGGGNTPLFALVALFWLKIPFSKFGRLLQHEAFSIHDTRC